LHRFYKTGKFDSAGTFVLVYRGGRSGRGGQGGASRGPRARTCAGGQGLGGRKGVVVVVKGAMEALAGRRRHNGG